MSVWAEAEGDASTKAGHKKARAYAIKTEASELQRLRHYLLRVFVHGCVRRASSSVEYRSSFSGASMRV